MALTDHVALPILPSNPLEPLWQLATYILKDILGFDPVIFFNLSIFLAACSAVSRYITGVVYQRIRALCMSSVTINEEDILYRYMTEWMADKHFKSKAFRSVMANTSAKTSLQDEEDALKAIQQDLTNPDGLISYRNLSSRNSIRFQPYQTDHIFLHKRNLFVFSHRIRSTPTMSRHMTVKYSSQLTLECFGRSVDPVKNLLEEAQTHYLSTHYTKTTIWRANGPNWMVVVARPSRSIDSVILEPEKKRSLLRDMNEYLHPRTHRWYANRGIPYRRGYLFYGKPGTGKTSLTAALAGVFGVDIYLISLVDPMITEDALIRLFSTVPSRSIILLEDVDAAELSRENDPKLSPKHSDPEQDYDDDGGGGSSNYGNRKRATGGHKGSKKSHFSSSPSSSSSASAISLSALLNAIDGVSSGEGRILIMTTNKPHELDPALIRPGRVDVRVRFELPHRAEMVEMFMRMYRGGGDEWPVATVVATTAAAAAADTKNGKGDEEEKKKKKEKNESSTTLVETAATATSTATATAPVPAPVPAPAESNNALSALLLSESQLKELAERFGDELPEGQLSLAAIQGYLLRYKTDAQGAVENARAWSEETLREANSFLEQDSKPESSGKDGNETSIQQEDKADKPKDALINGNLNGEGDGCINSEDPKEPMVNGVDKIHSKLNPDSNTDQVNGITT